MIEVVSKPLTKTAMARLRHEEFKAACIAYWRHKNPDAEVPWAQPEGRALEIWLRDNPDVSIDEFRQWLRHRSRSQVDHSERPSKWIGGIGFYQDGPRNRYGDLLGGAAVSPVRETIVPAPAASATGRSGGF